MVYIDRDGRVLEKRPWNFGKGRIITIFAGLWFLIVQFFQTIWTPFRGNNSGDNSRRSGGWGGSGGGGGGGGGSDSGGGNGGLRPNRRIGRITNSMDCNAPGGGCCG